MPRLTRATCVGAVLAALCIGSVSAAAQTQALTFVPSSSAGNNNDQSVGWQFNVVSGITVNGLGWYDDGADGLSVGHTVGIWDPAGNLLASVLVPAGTAAGLNGQYRTVSIANVFLGIGNGYIVGGQNFRNSTDFLAFNVLSQVVDPSIQFVDATFSGISSSLTRPTSFSAANDGFYGPGFTILSTTATPEPSTYVLMASGLIGVFGVVRRRRAA